MIRKRFSITRVLGIVGWTAVATAWATFGIAKATSQPAATTEPEPAAPGPAAEAATTTTAPVPDLPASGLVVIRYTPSPTPPPQPQVVTRVVTQRVVTQQQAAPKPATQGS